MDNKKWPNLIGKVVLVFDSNLWSRAGGDIGDNSCFHRLAEVVAQYAMEGSNNDAVVDVHWIDSGKLSKGHFIWGIQYSGALDWRERAIHEPIL